MATTIRPELSAKNKYWIPKHRYYELKHFCLQYPLWKSLYLELDDMVVSHILNGLPMNDNYGDPTANKTILKGLYKERVDLIDDIAKKTDRELCDYILKGVTEGFSYNYLKGVMNIPCGREMYYNRYRKFFWLLNQVRR